jgi:hypothetical protein
VKNRYRLVRRAYGIYYSLDKENGRRESLETTNKIEAEKLLSAKNDTIQQPALNKGMAKVYLSAASPEFAQKTVEETKAGYGFSDRVADFYAVKKDRFMLLRAARDAIVHGGKSPGFIFKLPRGFGINGDSPVGRELKRGNLWADLKPNENDLGSCLALVALLAKDLFDVLADVTGALTESINNLPVETAPGYRVFVRSQLSADMVGSELSLFSQDLVSHGGIQVQKSSQVGSAPLG